MKILQVLIVLILLLTTNVPSEALYIPSCVVLVASVVERQEVAKLPQVPEALLASEDVISSW